MSSCGVLCSASVRKIVLNTADVSEWVHILEPAPSSGFLELNWMPFLVLGQPDSVHGVVFAEFPPQPWVASVPKTTYFLNLPRIIT